MSEMTYAEWLPVIFVGLMGFSVLVYAILDGYDLGVGLLLPQGNAHEAQRDVMISSIGPFGMPMRRGWCWRLVCY